MHLDVATPSHLQSAAAAARVTRRVNRDRRWCPYALSLRRVEALVPRVATPAIPVGSRWRALYLAVRLGGWVVVPVQQHATPRSDGRTRGA